MLLLTALLAATASPTAGTQLHHLSDRYLAARAHEDPVDLVSASGTAHRLAEDRVLLAAVRRLDKRSLSPEDQIDAVLLDDALRYELWVV